MNAQGILLVFLVAALCITVGLYLWKAKKQIQYKGDERWKMIQLKANSAANGSDLVLICIAIVLPLVMDTQTTMLTLQRVITFALIYVGLRNFIELAAAIYFDKLL